MAISEINDKSVLLFLQHACSIDELKNLGFKFSSKEKIAATKASPESFKICLSNDNSRSIDLVFYPLPNDQGIILVYINNLDNGQVINLEDWLKKNNELPDANSFKLTSYVGELNDRWGAFFDFLSKVFNLAPVSKILCGDAWEDIPFDWAGIK